MVYEFVVRNRDRHQLHCNGLELEFGLKVRHPVQEIARTESLAVEGLVNTIQGTSECNYIQKSCIC